MLLTCCYLSVSLVARFQQSQYKAGRETHVGCFSHSIAVPHLPHDTQNVIGKQTNILAGEPSPGGRTAKFWVKMEEKRNKAKPSPPSCAQVPWGFALGEGPTGAQYFHYRRNSPPRQGLIPILPSWPSSLEIIYRFWVPEIKLGPWLLCILSQGLPLFDSLPLLH